MCVTRVSDKSLQINAGLSNWVKEFVNWVQKFDNMSGYAMHLQKVRSKSGGTIRCALHEAFDIKKDFLQLSSIWWTSGKFLSSGRSFASARASRSHYVWLSFCGIFHAWSDEYKTHVRGIFHTCLCDIPPIHKTSFSRQDGLGTVNPQLLRPGCHGLIRSWNQGSSFGFDIIYLKWRGSSQSHLLVLYPDLV